MPKVKVSNKNKFNIGVSLINPMREQNIRAGSFTIMEEDDVYYLDSICSLFKRGMLTFENETIKENLGYSNLDIIIKSDDEMIAILKGNHLKMKSELAKITEAHMKDVIYQIAKTISGELSGSKLKYLSEYCGKEIFIDEIQD